MSGRTYLLDTNILIAFFRKNQKVAQKLEQEDIFVPIIALGVLAYGVEKSLWEFSPGEESKALGHECANGRRMMKGRRSR